MGNKPQSRSIYRLRDERKVERGTRGASYLPFDVYFAECSSTKAFEKPRGLGNLHSVMATVLVIGPFFDKWFGIVRLEEFTASAIVLKAQFISEEAEGNILVPVAVVSIEYAW
jgi:hypothetical protein